MVKTQVPLTTVNLLCPHCGKTNPIAFSQQVTALPVAGLEVSEKVIGKCSTCGYTFDYKSKDMIFKFMDRNKLAYKRPNVRKNQLILAAPLLIILILALATAAFALHLNVPQSHDSPIVNASNASVPPIINGSRISPTPTPVPASPLVVNGTDRYDTSRGKYYLPVTLKAGSQPVDLQKMIVTVRMNNVTITPNAWEYGEDSCIWKVHNMTGAFLGKNDSATLVVDMSHYNFANGSVIDLDFTLPGYKPLTTNYIMSRNGSVILLPPVIYTGEYDVLAGKMVDVNATDLVRVSGRVLVNKWPATNIAVSFYDNHTTNTVTSIEDGYYTVNLIRNQTYRIRLWSTAYGNLMQDETPRIFVNDTTLDIKLTT